MKKHELKIWGVFFNAVVNGRKTFELRIMDRDYKVGDFILLREWDKNLNDYTGRQCNVFITYIYESTDFMREGYGVLGFKLVDKISEITELNSLRELQSDEHDIENFISNYLEMKNQIMTDKYFRDHLIEEIERTRNFSTDPKIRDILSTIMMKIKAKGRSDF